MKVLNGLDAGSTLFILIILLLLAVIPARIAAKKGYSFAGFYIFGVFFWLIALIVALVLKPKDVSQELLNFKKLLDQGVITQEEFNQKRNQLLK